MFPFEKSSITHWLVYLIPIDIWFFQETLLSGLFDKYSSILTLFYNLLMQSNKIGFGLVDLIQLSCNLKLRRVKKL